MLAAKWLEGYMLRALYEMAQDLQSGEWLINRGVPNARYLPDPCASPARVWFLRRRWRP